MRIITFVSTSTMTPPARAALELCRAARELGHEPILSGLVETRTPPEITALGAAADAEKIPFRLLWRRRRFDPGLVGQMETMFRRLKPNAYVSHDYLGAAVARISRFRPACVGHVLHDDIAHRWLGAKLLRLADLVVTRDEHHCALAEQCGVSRNRLMSASGDDWVADLMERVRPQPEPQ